MALLRVHILIIIFLHRVGTESVCGELFFSSFFLFFFFQAEDGIRDLIVTGVQTCALPICLSFPGILTEPLAITGTGPSMNSNSLPLWGPSLIQGPQDGIDSRIDSSETPFYKSNLIND
mgnify:CR=1 FL=1